MSLKFSKLSISNFGPYLGKQIVDLDVPDTSPVILIHGENTLGKTQFFSALRWCLYGTFGPQQSKSKATLELPERLNKIARRSGDQSLEVSIQIISDGDLLSITRSADLANDPPEVSCDMTINAVAVPAGHIDTEIGRLLHPQISEFFLFDAELLDRFYERLASDRERALIKESIERVLGIPALQRAQQDVQLLANDALKKQSKHARNRNEAGRIEKNLSELRDRHASRQRDLEEISDALETSEAELLAKRDELKLVEGLQADMRDQEMLEARLATINSDIAGLKAELQEILSRGWRAPIAPVLHEKLQEVQAQNSLYETRQQEIAAGRLVVRTLEERVHGGDCPTCKQKLPPPTAETEADLDRARKDLAQRETGPGGRTLDLQLERLLISLIDNQTVSQYGAVNRRLQREAMLQYDIERNLETIKGRLRGHDVADIRLLAEQCHELEQAISESRATQEACRSDLAAIGLEQKALGQRLRRLPGDDPEIAYEATFFQYVDDLLHGTIGNYRSRVRERIEHDAENMFLKLVHDPAGYGNLRISPDYRLELLNTYMEPRATSEGGKQLLALSLIGALKRAAIGGGPVVLDSPLGRLDLEHRANVLRVWLPWLGSQTILLVQSGELTNEDASRLLGNQIGFIYEIMRPDGNPEHAVIERG
jgi:DNA sulfur modification protein DndD